ncbi:hypothetical protein PDPUS_1_02652 [Photobacterium damselae subsp. piscicida]|uniref:KfrA N-terminal DNA-binding domain-containing protein n=2 Tax=Photobacterium damselae TaxID=38293 RepID=A0A1V1V5G5_PHODP|nr:hypothetical protein [Photobacterium damselae]MBE8128492.1 hypothetical protein [Photobacterium damselae subsp. piscicida]MDP2513934.1 hypothetical protein [Photobacterium damselae subsp. piscicida]MDP2533817.1 hypothetical protein [Photobacterium damselae subsp. piscicida]MDP2545618.1 hypothetical protein [Photobacterium damselae subsp. piscicida]MDP2568949.1 hypothetical protein [Photobacterium damselae subsp. piscicida]
MTSAISQDLQQAIQSLVSEGKQPSVALMKARLAQNVPMPIIIQALQSWKKNAKVPKITEHKREISLEQRIEQLERQVAILTQRLSQLES